MDIQKRAPFIVVSGLIGAGKTTLTTQLADALGYTARFEPVASNPYLEDFYKDQARWSFPMQMFFLAQRFKAHQEIVWGGKPAILDRSIYEDTIFARMHYEEGTLDARDWETYISHFHVMQGFLRYPDVILYLNVSPEKALERINLRSRDAEAGLPLEYLQKLHKGYEEFVEEMARYTVVIDLDWAEYQPTWKVVERIQQETQTNQKFLRSLRRI